MIADDYREIIEREIDGRATAEESQRLAAYLDAHPEERSRYEDAKRLSLVLRGVKSEDPPARLKADILRAIGVRPPAQVRQPSWFEQLLAPFRSRNGVRYALSFGAGAVAGLALLIAMGKGPGIGSGSEEIAGTMGSSYRVKGLEGVAARMLDFGETRGAITTKSDGELVIAEIELQSPHDVEVVLEYPSGLVPRGFEVSESGGGMRLGQTEARFLHRGEARYGIFLQSETRAPSSLKIKLTTAEGSFEETLEALPGEES